ncbi:MAG: AI-2E family transporter [Bacteroidetes bacterium]|nr:AI-2E family transporter [Bacteroidota bacterium]
MRNEVIKQILLAGFILLLVFIIGSQLYVFFPGMLGAVTLYIILRQYYFKLTVIRKWNKTGTALLFVFGTMILVALPVAGLIQVLLPKLTTVLDNQKNLADTLNSLTVKLQNISPHFQINEQQIANAIQKLTGMLPGLLNATANMLTNMVLAFFILYFMLVDGRKMEQVIQRYMPLQDANIDSVWLATRTMVISNAIGIPIVAASQGLAAMLGYYIFGISDYLLWGVLTGIVSVVPLVGCMIIWGPLCIYLYATGHSGAALGLALYSFIVTGSIDNVLRFTILKRVGDVHPIITALGIIVGIPLFGFMGFIFGPLLISYLLLMISIYRTEFSGNNT